MKAFDSKVQTAAARFLDRRGYEVLDQKWEAPEGNGCIDIVAKDEDTLVFVIVKGRKATEKGAKFYNATAKMRETYESLAMQYLAAHAKDYVDCPVRFDVLSMVVIAEDRALMRHHINAFCAANSEEE